MGPPQGKGEMVARDSNYRRTSSALGCMWSPYGPSCVDDDASSACVAAEEGHGYGAMRCAAGWSRAYFMQSRAHLVRIVLVLALFAAHAAFLQHPIGGDGTLRHQALLALLDEGRLTDAKYSLIAPLFSLPLLMLDRAFGSGDWVLSRFNLFVLGVGVWALYRIVARRESKELASTFCLLLLCASFLPFSAGMYYGEMFTMVACAIGLHGVVRGNAVVGWGLLALGVANVPPLLVPLGAFALMRALASRSPWPLLAPLVAGLAVACENALRRGSPMSFGYDEDGVLAQHVMPYTGLGGFSYPLPLGLLGLFFASGIGLFVFAPGAFFVFSPHRAASTLRATLRAWCFFVVATACVFAKWWSWGGGAYWGPRFLMLGALPATFWLAQHARRRDLSFFGDVFTLFALAWSTWVCANGVGWLFHTLLQDPALHQAEGSAMIWVPDVSPLWYAIERPALPFPATLAYIALAVTGSAVVGAPVATRCLQKAPDALRDLAQRVLRSFGRDAD